MKKCAEIAIDSEQLLKMHVNAAFIKTKLSITKLFKENIWILDKWIENQFVRMMCFIKMDTMLLISYNYRDNIYLVKHWC